MHKNFLNFSFCEVDLSFSMGFNKWVVAGACLALSCISTAQTVPAGVTASELARQLKSLSEREQRELARQYEIDLPQSEGGVSDSPSGLGSPGEPLTSPENTDELRLVEGKDPREPDAQSTRRPYGSSLFDTNVATFAPTDNAPVPATYRLGVGDEISIQLYGKESERFSVQIGRSGEVSFPKLGPIYLSGLTLDGARDLIKTRVAKEFLGVEVMVGMGRLRAINIFMAGEVKIPGAYSVSALTTITQSLFQAGGVNRIGSLRRIDVRRDGVTVETFDVYDLLMKGDVSKDIRLQSGDVVFVPPVGGLVSIEGEVKRPHLYELRGSETLHDLVQMAGGFSASAYPQQSVVTSNVGMLGVSSTKTLDLTSPIGGSSLAIDGDVLFVPKMSGLVTKSIRLRGAVTRPGIYGWQPEMRVSDLLTDFRKDFLREADMGIALLIRERDSSTNLDVLYFEPSAVLDSPDSSHDPKLNEFDEILIFSSLDDDSVDDDSVDDDSVGDDSVDDLTRQGLLSPIIERLRNQALKGDAAKLVSISGAVKEPGTYPLPEQADVSVLIQMAGGLVESAFQEAAELRTLRVRADGGIEPEYTEISLIDYGKSMQFPFLQSRDHLTVREIPDWTPGDAVEIDGEVAFPGTYLIRKGERLRNVIERAGGLTPNASAESAIFTRRSVAELEAKRAADFARSIENDFATRLLTEEEVSKSVSEVNEVLSFLKDFEGEGRLLVDLPGALSQVSDANIELVDGDRIVVPKFSNTITVVGAVNVSATHTYQPDITVNDYIALSAGLTRRADKNAMYVVAANGTVKSLEQSLWEFSRSNFTLEPGDTIVVPINVQYKDSLASLTEITQILYSSIVSLAALASL